MKLGSAMDPNEARRGNRAYRFHPNVGLVPLDEGPKDGEEEEDAEASPPNLEGEPDDPDDPDAAA